MQTLSTEQFRSRRDLIGEQAVINVLPTDDYNKAHIPGSQNVPVDSEGFEEAIENKIGGKDQPVIVYCASKECNASSTAAKQLEAAGFQEVYDYEGGMADWQENEEPVESGAGSSA